MKTSARNQTIQEEVISLIYRVAKQMHKHMELGDGVREEVTPGQLHALFILSKGACSAGTLARELNVALPSVTSLTNRMVYHGWAIREDDPNDRRIVQLLLTPKGKSVLEKAKRARYRRLSFLLNAMPEGDVLTLHRIFSDLNQRLEREKPKTEEVEV